MAALDETKEKKKLNELLLREEEDLAQILSTKYAIPYIDLDIVTINNDSVKIIPEDRARDGLLVAFQSVAKDLYVAAQSPQREKTQMVLKDLEARGYRVLLYICSKASLDKGWERYNEVSYATSSTAGILDIANDKIDRYAQELSNLSSVKKIIQENLSAVKKLQASSLLEVALGGAISLNASDIHIEPEETFVKMRFRVDGVLQDVTKFDPKFYKLVLSRVKLLSGLKLNVHDDAQDGRFSIKAFNIEIEIRTSVIPGNYGESIVMRILNPTSIAVPLESLGIEPVLLSIINREIMKPNGMILNTGPTGSGKTTTLYAILKQLNSSEIKIITIEDPIEYHLSGITQTQVADDKGYTFLQGLRSSLRQDPDVIMVGEIRDSETAQTAVHAALTGHLVLSTLHTNNAAGAIPRMIDLSVNAKIIGSAVNLALAQRLVRTLCNACKKKDTPTPEEREIIERVLSTIKRDTVPALENIWRSVGCNACNSIGFKGRIGIFEGILINEKIEAVIVANPSERELRKTASDQGMLTLQQDGIIKVVNGVTSIDELQRVIDVTKDIY